MRYSSSKRILSLAGLTGIVGLLVWTFPRISSSQAAAVALSQAAVASESHAAAADARAILEAGGNAADAAIVATLSAGVTSPTSSGIGGGGFLVAYDAKKRQVFALDFRERAGAVIERNILEQRPLPLELSGALVGVPGELRGLAALWKRLGSKTWRELVLPAMRRARDGYAVGTHLANMLNYGEKKLKPVPGFGIYYPKGKPAVVGARIKNPALARTLALIAEKGPNAFYEGPVAEAFVSHARKNGSQLNLNDLKTYQVEEREALKIRYAGHEVYTMPPPSAGGLMMIQLMKLFSPDELKALGLASPAYLHLLAEGMRGAIADRMRYLGDPAFTKVKLEELLADERLLLRRQAISASRTHAMPRFGLEEHGTHHLSTGDAQGNLVSLTTTVNRLFGSKLMVEKYGIVQNDELDDFNRRDDVTGFALADTPNPPRALARPISSMTPTIVLKDGAPRLAIGGSGGTAIATNVSQVLLSTLLFKQTAQQAVSAPRFYVPFKGATLMLDEGFPDKTWSSLRERGEVVRSVRFKTTGVQMVQIREGRADAAADPRKHGLAWVNSK